MQTAKASIKRLGEWLALWLLFHIAHLLLMPLVNFMGWGWRANWFADGVDSAIIVSGWAFTDGLHKIAENKHRKPALPISDMTQGDHTNGSG